MDPTTREALAERLRFYREIGIYDFYRRPVEEVAPGETVVDTIAASESEPMLKTLPVLQDRSAALKLIREDLGDCTRCKLHKQGRKQIVFGVGNMRPLHLFSQGLLHLRVLFVLVPSVYRYCS